MEMSVLFQATSHPVGCQSWSFFKPQSFTKNSASQDGTTWKMKQSPFGDHGNLSQTPVFSCGFRDASQKCNLQLFSSLMPVSSALERMRWSTNLTVICLNSYLELVNLHNRNTSALLFRRFMLIAIYMQPNHRSPSEVVGSFFHPARLMWQGQEAGPGYFHDFFTDHWTCTSMYTGQAVWVPNDIRNDMGCTHRLLQNDCRMVKDYGVLNGSLGKQTN